MTDPTPRCAHGAPLHTCLSHDPTNPDPLHPKPRQPGLYVVFDGPPNHESGRFVEVEDETGASVSVAEWRREGDLWALGPFATARPLPPTVQGAADDGAAVPPQSDTLGAAWAECEAALPKVWPTHGVSAAVALYWNATATTLGQRNGWTATGPTPAAALRALAVMLREGGS